MDKKQTQKELIRLLPHWHYKIEKSIRKGQKAQQLSYENYFCLMNLERYGTLKMGELARAMRLSKQQATHMIECLNRLQLIERKADPADRRSINIQISKQGSAYLAAHPLDSSTLWEQLEQVFTEEDMEDFQHSIHTLLSLLNKFQ